MAAVLAIGGLQFGGEGCGQEGGKGGEGGCTESGRGVKALQLKGLEEQRRWRPHCATRACMAALASASALRCLAMRDARASTCKAWGTGVHTGLSGRPPLPLDQCQACTARAWAARGAPHLSGRTAGAARCWAWAACMPGPSRCRGPQCTQVTSQWQRGGLPWAWAGDCPPGRRPPASVRVCIVHGASGWGRAG